MSNKPEETESVEVVEKEVIESKDSKDEKSRSKDKAVKKERKTSKLSGGVDEFIEQLTRHEFEEATSNFLTAIGDSWSNFTFSFKKIVKAIVSEEGVKRAAILTGLVYLLKNFTGKIDIMELYTIVLNKCQRSNDPFEKMTRNSAIFLCFTAISHAGLLKTEKDIIYKMVKAVYTIGHQLDSIRLLAYQVILDILKFNEVTAEEYKEHVKDHFHGKFESKDPETIDQLYFEIRLGMLYPSVDCLVDVEHITSLESLKKYTPALKGTVHTNGQHPIWKLLCEINHKEVNAAATELWIGGEDASVKNICADAIASVLNVATKEEVLEIARNHALIDFVAHVSKSSFENSFISALERNADIKGEVIKTLLLGNYTKNPLVAAVLFKVLITLNDEDTELIAKDVDGMNFSAIKQFLMAQPKRESLANDKIVSKIFNAAIKKAEEDADKKALLKFALSLIYEQTPKGEQYYKLLIGKKTTAKKGEMENTKEMLKNLNAVLTAIHQITTKIGLKVDDGAKKFANTNDIAQFFGKIKKDNLPYPSTFVKDLIMEVVPFLEGESCSIVAEYPITIAKAIACKNTCPYAVKYILKNTKNLPKEVKNQLKKFDFSTLPIEGDDAVEIIKESLNYAITDKVVRQLIDAIIEKTEDEKKAEIVTEKFSNLVEGDKKKVICKEIIGSIVSGSKGASKALVDVVAKTLKDGKTIETGLLHVTFDWLEKTIGKVDGKEFMQLVVDLIPKEYPESSSGEKKAEENLRWLHKMTTKVETEPEMLKPFANLVSKSKCNFIKTNLGPLMPKQE